MYFLTMSPVMAPASARLGFMTSLPKSWAPSKCLSGFIGAKNNKYNGMNTLRKVFQNLGLNQIFMGTKN